MAVRVFPNVKQKLDCLRGREYWWEGKAGKFLCVDTRSCLLMYDAWEKGVKREILSHADGLFVDVGANIGRLSVFAGKVGMKVLAIEPNPKTCKALETNLRINGVDGSALNVAAWKEETVLPLYHGKSSALDNVHGADVWGGNTTKTYDVKAVTLDSLNLEPAVIKIDTEESEVEVLEGARRTLREEHPVVIYESFKGDKAKRCRVLLESLGYRIMPLDKRNYVAH